MKEGAIIMQPLLENKLIAFLVNQNEYAISVDEVGSIERVLPITRVPSAPKYVKGVINLRGIITPVIDLKKKLHNKSTKFTDQTRILIVHIESLTVGLIVEGANDVIDIQTEQIETPPETVESDVLDYIEGVIKLPKRLLILLDMAYLLNDSDDIESTQELKRLQHES